MAEHIVASEIRISSHGDDLEQQHWERLAPYIHRYELVWRALVVPLRSPGFIYFRDGIDEDFEEFAMCHYTTYVNVARALDKMEGKADDFKFAEEIWANLHRAAEVATKAVNAFRIIYLKCSTPRRNPVVNTTSLNKLETVLKKYRNTLHGPMIGTAKEEGVRLIPDREKLEKYHRWTSIMYHKQLDDFSPVETLLWADFRTLCSNLQQVWSDIETRIPDISHSAEFLRRQSAGTSASTMSTTNPFGASGTFIQPVRKK